MAMDEMEDILGSFEEAVGTKRSSMSENTFNEVFKPVFEGRIEDNHRLIEKWVELAGCEYSPVDLVDDNGEVVATVSGILRPLDKDNREDYKNILNKYEKATSVLRINPVRGVAMENAVAEEVSQGLLPSNAKSREYIVYKNKPEATPKRSKGNEKDMYDI